MPAERAVAFAPGRVNLIGEHTDYNGGLSLPFAIQQGVTVTASAIAGDEVHADALDHGESDRFALQDPGPASGWRAFVHGAVGELRAAGYAIPAARLEITGDIPEGSGLSSSAALGVSLTLALLGLAGDPEPDRLDLARLCSRIENHWVGAQSGLLDPIAVLMGRPEQALRIDFRSLEVDQVPLHIGSWQLVTLPSGETHSLATGGYNERRAECELACAELGIVSLRDALPEQARELPEPLNRRALHVIEENARVDETIDALRRDDLAQVGKLLDASHASLRDLYDSSTPAVERTVARCIEAGAAGARMVGGGFGGQVLALFAPDVPAPAQARAVSPGAGARLVEVA